MRSSLYILLLLLLQTALADAQSYSRAVGQKQWETSNHLGNVVATTSDRKVAEQAGVTSMIAAYESDVVSYGDYYPYGMLMEGRGDDEGYRFGFNGMERDDEVQGAGGSYDFGARVYDGRVGRWWSVDPLSFHYRDLSPFNFVDNSPLIYVDVAGKWIYPVLKSHWKKNTYKSEIKIMNGYSILNKNYEILNSFGNMPNTKKKSGSKAMSYSLKVIVRDMTAEELAETNGQGIGFSTGITNVTEKTYHEKSLIHEMHSTEIALSDKGMNYGTISEEFLHAGQKLYYQENNVAINSISLELEAKLIKVYAVWQDNQDMEAADLESVLKSMGVQDYELDILFEYEYDKNTGQSNGLVGYDLDVLTLFKGQETFNNYSGITAALKEAGSKIEQVYHGVKGWKKNEVIDTNLRYFRKLSSNH